MTEEYEFTIGFQKLTGLSEGGAYGIAWRKGAETGRTKRAIAEGSEAAFGTQVKVVEAKRGAGKGKQLFEVYVNKYAGDAKTTIGMLYMDLTMHIPKTGKPMVKQSACLQLSNCVDPSIRLALTVHCQPKAGEDPDTVINQLRDEISNLKRQNEMLKVEESYTYSNQPVRHNVKALEEKIEALTKDLHCEREGRGIEVARLQDVITNMRTIHSSQVAELEGKVEYLKRKHADEMSDLHDKLNKQFKKTVEDNKVTSDTQGIELNELNRELIVARNEILSLKKQIEDLKATQSHMTSLHETRVKEGRVGEEERDRLREEKSALERHLEVVEAELCEVKRQSYEERAATEEAKQMLGELMEKLSEAKHVEDSLQSALAVADEEKLEMIKTNKDLVQQIASLEDQLTTIRSEQYALSHYKQADLQTELETQKLKAAEALVTSHHARQEVEELRQSKQAAEETIQEQKVKLAQRKNRITDLKRILGLHLKMKQAQMLIGDTLNTTCLDLPMVP
eukprot:TRINITY_DN23510_c0_g1_i1.p1 TRINITY_DN23510_c0_g1~~TRINITY_DN23510_c0_g1_i1.p1  ORF type:complete len:526 (+),score=130.20 TRINITY_DN23510_c0_g1_i1:53-1579(+)